MTRIARIIAAALLSVALPAAAAGVQAQAPLFEVERSDAKLLRVNDDAGLLVGGTFGAGGIPATGAGVRLMWYPKVGSLRAGLVNGSQWDEASIGHSSVAFGENTIASGAYSTATGYHTSATADAATALGRETTASGGRSTALGFQTTASGAYATATGYLAVARGAASLAAGYRVNAAGERTVALGEGTTASGLVATAMGYLTTASGTTSTAMGHTTSATGEASTAMGAHTVASADFAVAQGFNTKASGNYSTSMGFETQASGISSTAMGAASVAAGLGSVAMGTRAIAQGNGSFAFADRSSTNSVTAFDNEFVVRAHGGIGFNSGPSIGCDLPAGVGAWACTSSRLAKEGFEEVDGEAVLAKLARIPIQRWSYLGTRSAHVGPTAEDFHGAFGLGEGPTTITTVDADGIALLGVQTLERRTAELRAENAELRAGHADLLRRLQALEVEMASVKAPQLRMSRP